MHKYLIIGSFDRRPNASTMPSGNEAAMPVTATTSVTSRRPISRFNNRQSEQTAGEHDESEDRIEPKQKRNVEGFERRDGTSMGTSPIKPNRNTRFTRQISACGYRP